MYVLINRFTIFITIDYRRARSDEGGGKRCNRHGDRTRDGIKEKLCPHFLRSLWFYISLTLSLPASVFFTCFVNSLSTAASELLVCIISSYVRDSQSPIGGESNLGSTRSCRWEAESSGRTTIIECCVFGIGIGTEIAVRRSEWWAGCCWWDSCLASWVETAVGIGRFCKSSVHYERTSRGDELGMASSSCEM